MSRTLSESDSLSLLAGFGVPILASELCSNAEDAAAVAAGLGFPVVAKLCGDTIAHKTERGLVRLSLSNEDEVRQAAVDLLAQATPADGEVSVLIAPMLAGNRELIIGLSTDPQFGSTVMLGVGGILAEVIADVSVRLVPITRFDGYDMIDSLDTRDLLGEFRGEVAVDREALVDALMALSFAAVAMPEIVSADCNPLIVNEGKPVAVDALVELVA